MKKIFTTLLTCCLGIAAMSAQQTVFIGETGYDSLQAACDAVTTGGTIRVTGDQTITRRVNITGTKDFTVTGENNAKIINGIGSSLVILLKGNDYKGTATFEGLVFDGNNKENGQAFFENNTSNSLVIKNCTFTNIKCTNENRTCVNAKGNLTLENVSVTNSANKNRDFALDQSGRNITVKGTGEYSITVGKHRPVIADGFTGKITLTIMSDSNGPTFNDGETIVENGNIENFTITGAPEGKVWSLEQSGTNLIVKIADAGEPTPDPEPTTGPVKNVTTGTSYEDLPSAVAAANANDVIEINENITMTGRMLISNQPVTIQGATDGITITRNFINALFFGSDKKNLTLKNLILDCNNMENSSPELEAGGANLTLENVTIKNSKTTKNLVNVKGGNRNLFAANFVAENCANKNGYLGNDDSKNQTARVTLTGNNAFSIVCSSATNIITVGEAGISNTEPISITLPETAMTAGKVVVNGCTDPALFTIEGLGEDLELAAVDGNLVITAKAAEVNAVVNETTGAKYATLDEAVNTAADGDVLVINEAITIGGRLDPKVNLTIKGAGETPVTVTKNFTNALIATGNKNITYENLVFDCAEKANNNFEFEVNSGGTLTFTNVKIINSATTRNIFNVKGGRNLYLTDVTVENCGNNENINLNDNAKVNLSGNNIVSVLFCQPTAGIVIAGELTNENPINIRLTPVEGPAAQADTEIEAGLDPYKVLVTNATEADAAKFALLNQGWRLKYENDAIIATNDVRDGVEDIHAVAGAGIVNVYDMTGRTVRTGVEAADATDGLPRGMYIVGGSKVVVK